ncbi:MAG TPA: hypothetical protein VK750_07975, partial [Cytophagaceae bacterium]|nr:hypothetical protein [Cytophagaceae bacterium]
MKTQLLFLSTIIAILMAAISPLVANPIFWSPTTNSGLSTSFSIVLSPDAGAATYTIEVWTDPTYSTAPIQSQTSAARNYTASGLSYGATYYLRGRSNVSTAGYYALKTVTITSSVPESIPTIVNGTILNSNPTFYTSAVGNATNYEFQFDTVSTFNSSSLIDVNSSNTSVQLTRYTLKSGMTYYIRARATAGSVGPWTSIANVKHFVAELHATTFWSPASGSTMN